MAENIFEKNVVYRIPGMDQVEISADIHYSSIDSEYLLMDIYRPKGAAPGDSYATVLFVHGGPISESWGINPKEMGQYQSYGRLLAASGMVAVTFNHRLFDVQSFPDSEEDLLQALDFVRTNSSSYNIDPERICIWYVSFGGPLLSIPLRRDLSFLRCLIAYYAPLDLMISENDQGKNMLRRYSPVSILSEGGGFNIPILIAGAGLDNVDLNATIDEFISIARSRELPVTYIRHDTGRHAFDILDDDERSREIIRTTIEFISENASRR